MRDCKNCRHYIVDRDKAGCELWECEFESKEQSVSYQTGELIIYRNRNYVTLRETDNFLLVMDSDMDCMWIDKSEVLRTGKVLSQFMEVLFELQTYEWITEGSLSARCSGCGCKSQGHTPYCPMCGRKMLCRD